MAASFWSNIPLIFRRNIPRFDSRLRILSESVVPAPPNGCQAYRIATEGDIPILRTFLEANFGQPPRTPLFRPELNPSSQEIILYVTNINPPHDIAGTVRYKHSGIFERNPISIVDCFCVAPEWRQRGLGTYLLSAIHEYTNARDMRYSIFLKEGAPILAPTMPFYSSVYAYRAISNTHTTLPPSPSYSISHEMALRVIGVYREFWPDTFIIIKNVPHVLHWRFWHRPSHFILACYQNTYQIHPANNGRIGICTGWLETPNINSDIRTHIQESFTDSLPYEWLWSDAKWIGDAPGWRRDGQFHWYAYQWDSSIRPAGSYIINI